jgi:hypothetical protein
MSYQIGWFRRYHIIEEQIKGSPSVAEIEQHFAACEQLLAEAAEAAPRNMVHLLIDARQAESVPPIYEMIQPGARLLTFKNRGRAVLVTQNPKVRTVYEITSRLGGDRYVLHIYPERAEALAFLDALLVKEGQWTQG